MSAIVRILSGMPVIGAENAIPGLLWYLNTSRSQNTLAGFRANSTSAYRFVRKSAKNPAVNVETKTMGF